MTSIRCERPPFAISLSQQQCFGHSVPILQVQNLEGAIFVNVVFVKVQLLNRTETPDATKNARGKLVVRILLVIY